MINKYLGLSLLLITFSLLTNAQQLVPAFPTAEGYGKYATGGRGGKVVFVENLEDYIAYNNMEAPIPGSFRWALTQFPGEPLTIIFRVSGTIQLKPFIVSGKNQNDIRSSRSRLTIAGQTAPGEGITIRNSKVNLGGSVDLIVRNVRFRIGENAADSTFIPGGSVGCENATRVIFDHCVFGWSGEENLTMYDNRFTTVQWSLFHEGLFDDGHGKGNRSYAGQFGGVNATYHNNLIAHNQSRSPRLNGARTDNEVRVFIEFINNVVYNWGSTEAAYGADTNLGTLRSHTANLVGNYYKPGPATSSTRRFFTNYIVNNATLPKWHVSGNVMEGNASMTSDNWLGFAFKWSGTAGTALPTKAQVSSDTLLAPPSTIVFNGSWVGYEPFKLNIKTAQQAFNDVIAKAGTVNRDTVERRVFREAFTGTATFKASQGSFGIIDKSYNAEGFVSYAQVAPPVDNDRDGMADDWELANGLNPNDPEDRNKLTLSGYTALEVYLNSLMGETIPLEFATGLENTENGSIRLYPNITEDQFLVESSIPVQKVNIFSLNGTLAYSTELNNNKTVRINHLSQGLYLIEVKVLNGYTQHFRIIKH
jgi:hypothetical protein